MTTPQIIYGRQGSFSPDRMFPPLNTAESDAENTMLGIEQRAGEAPQLQSDGNWRRPNFVAEYGDYAAVQPPAPSSWTGNIAHATKYWNHSYVPIHHLHQLESLVKCVTCASMAFFPLLAKAAWNCVRQRPERQYAFTDLKYAVQYITCGMVCAVKHAVLTVCIDPFTYAMRCAYPVTHLLIVVTPQLDYLPAHADDMQIDGERIHHNHEGRAPIADGHTIFGTRTSDGRFTGGLNELMQRFNGAVVATKDEHPIERRPYGGFAAMLGVPQDQPGRFNGVDGVIGSIFKCCVGTRGSQFSWRLDQSRIQWVAKTGTEYTSLSRGGFANADGQKTLLEKYAKAIGVRQVDIAGLSHDRSVVHTAIQSMDAGFATRVLMPVVRSNEERLAAPDQTLLQETVQDILIVRERDRVEQRIRTASSTELEPLRNRRQKLLTKGEHDALQARANTETDADRILAYQQSARLSTTERSTFEAEAARLCNGVTNSQQAWAAQLAARGVTIVNDIQPLLNQGTTDAAYAIPR